MFKDDGYSSEAAHLFEFLHNNNPAVDDDARCGVYTTVLSVVT
jgi:hypothetical protein